MIGETVVQFGGNHLCTWMEIICIQQLADEVHFQFLSSHCNHHLKKTLLLAQEIPSMEFLNYIFNCVSDAFTSGWRDEE